MKSVLKEIPLVLITALPLIYLLTIWNDLPESVPTHFDLSGTPDGWSKKTSLPWIIGGIGYGLYAMMLIIPLLDPKKKIQQMDTKYYSLRAILAIFFMLLNGYLIYAAAGGNTSDNMPLFVIMGAMFAALGNYFQTVRPNYFVGIRTPWTLENEEIWKKTHRVSGRLWMVGGILIIVTSLVINETSVRGWIIGIILFVIVIWPFLYSFLEFKKLNK